MLLSAVSVLVVAQSSSEIPEGLMNNPLVGSGHVSYLGVASAEGGAYQTRCGATTSI